MTAYYSTLEKSISQTLGKATRSIPIDGRYSGCKGILVYQQHQMLLLLMHDQNIRVDFSTILSYNVHDNSSVETSSYGSSASSTTKTDTGNLIGRAVIGGAIAGGVGAIVGASSAKKHTETSFNGNYTKSRTKHDYTLYLHVNSLEKPVIKIWLGQDVIALNEISAILNVILNLSLEKTFLQSDAEIEKLDTYRQIEQKFQSQKIKKENEKKEKEKKQEERKIAKLQAENTFFAENPYVGIKHFFHWGHIVALLSIPLGLAATLTFTWNIRWWMIITFILFVIAVITPLLISVAMMCSQNREDTSDFDAGFIVGLALLLIVISLFPVFLCYDDFTHWIYQIFGIAYQTYEGGLIVFSCMTLFIISILFFIIVCASSDITECRNDPTKHALYQRFIWGTISGLGLSFLSYAISLLLGWAIFTHTERLY